MSEQGRISKNVSLYEKEESVVSALANSKGLDFSSALRMIINEWSELQRLFQAEQPIQQEG